MDERTTGLILRTRPLTETSLIVHWLTRDLGRIATVAKGARRAKSPFQGKLDLFYLADFSFRRSLKSELHNLREVSVRDFHSALRGDIGLLQQAAYFVGLLEQTTETETPIAALFELMCRVLALLPAWSKGSLPVLAFEAKLLVEHGLQPDCAKSQLSPGSREILSKILAADWTTISRLRLSPQQNRELAGFLQNVLTLHFNRIPRGRAEALQTQPL